MQEAEEKVNVQTSLMGLIDDDRVVTPELAISRDLRQQDSVGLQAQTDATIASKNALLITLKDSVFMLLGDTLIGKITIDKDNNQYLFRVNDTIEDILSPKKVKCFTVAADAKNNEPMIYTAIFGDFYKSELGKSERIILYSKITYNKITNDGPIYYTVKKKYCLYKNSMVYFPESVTLKQDLLALTSDCSVVAKRIKKEKIKPEDIPSIVLDYNRCDMSKSK